MAGWPSIQWIQFCPVTRQLWRSWCAINKWCWPVSWPLVRWLICPSNRNSLLLKHRRCQEEQQRLAPKTSRRWHRARELSWQPPLSPNRSLFLSKPKYTNKGFVSFWNDKEPLSSASSHWVKHFANGPRPLVKESADLFLRLINWFDHYKKR